MASPQRNPKDLKKMIEDTKQDMGDVHRALEKLRNLPQDERTEAAMLWSRIDEQSSLICILKQRADELLLRCQALEQINMELEDLRANVQTELENERKRSKLLEERFMDLAANHQELIHFKDEYKQQNLVLVDENKRLQEENAKHFCKELQEKEAMVSKLTQELRDLAEQHKNLDTEYKDKTTGFQIKLKELISLHQKKEASLQDELHDTQKQLQNARDMFTELGLKLKQTKERDTKKETETHEKVKALTKEKNNLLDLSIQKEKMIQDKQAKIQQLEQEKQEAEEARVKAVDRFEREAAAVDGTLRVQELQHALEKAEETCSNLKKGFEAYKKHSSELLAKEKELNARLRHMTT